MVWIQRLKVQGVRNIGNAHLQRLSRVNHIYGANGAGKTSVLEALHLLGLGRSFRSSKQLPIIAHRESSAIVYGELISSPSGIMDSIRSPSLEALVGIGVQRNRDGTCEFRINGQRGATTAQLAELLPLQVIDADTFGLLLGPPGTRRQFLDWGVFHVEHEFLDLWRRLQRILKQRNSLLRRGKMNTRELGSWDAEFGRLAESITDMRSDYFAQWCPVFFEIFNEIGGGELPAPDIHFSPGWDRRLTAGEMLKKQLKRDKDVGFTGMGPHRADLRLRINGLPVGEVLSRGQLKLVSVAMRLSQGHMLDLATGKHCVFLVDDLPAELDRKRRAAVISLLLQRKGQVFFTSVDKSSLDLSGADTNTLSVFHVEHGTVHQ